MPPKRPRIVPSQTDLSVQDVRDYSTPEGAAMANEEMRRLKMALQATREQVDTAAGSGQAGGAGGAGTATAEQYIWSISVNSELVGEAVPTGTKVNFIAGEGVTITRNGPNITISAVADMSWVANADSGGLNVPAGSSVRFTGINGVSTTADTGTKSIIINRPLQIKKRGVEIGGPDTITLDFWNQHSQRDPKVSEQVHFDVFDLENGERRIKAWVTPGSYTWDFITDTNVAETVDDTEQVSFLGGANVTVTNVGNVITISANAAAGTLQLQQEGVDIGPNDTATINWDNDTALKPAGYTSRVWTEVINDGGGVRRLIAWYEPGAGGTYYWNLQANGGAIEQIDNAETVNFAAGGNLTVARAGNTITYSYTQPAAYYWNLQAAGGAIEQIDTTETVNFTASGNLAVTRTGNTINYSYTQPAAYSWVASNGPTDVTISTTNEVTWLGDSGVTVALNAATKTFTIDRPLQIKDDGVNVGDDATVSINYDSNGGTGTSYAEFEVADVGGGERRIRVKYNPGAGQYYWNLQAAGGAIEQIDSNETVNFAAGGDLAVARAGNTVTYSYTQPAAYYWNLQASGGATEKIDTTESVNFAASGDLTVARTGNTITYSYTQPAAYSWVASNGPTDVTISTTNEVTWLGDSGVTVSLNATTKTFTIDRPLQIEDDGVAVGDDATVSIDFDSNGGTGTSYAEFEVADVGGGERRVRVKYNAGAGQYWWNLQAAGGAIEQIDSNETVNFVAAGDITVARAGNTITYTYNQPAAYYWNLQASGGATEKIDTTETVNFTASGNLVVTRTGNTINYSYTQPAAYYWNLQAGGGATEQIDTAESVNFAAGGDLAVSRTGNTITYSYTQPAAYSWVASNGPTDITISSTNEVTWVGDSGVVVSLDSPTKTFTIDRPLQIEDDGTAVGADDTTTINFDSNGGTGTSYAEFEVADIGGGERRVRVKYNAGAGQYYWNLQAAGGAIEQIDSNETVNFAAGGDITVARVGNTVTYSYTQPAAYYWNIQASGGATEQISTTETVNFAVSGNLTVTRTGNTITYGYTQPAAYYWNLQANGGAIEQIDTTEAVNFAASGNLTVSRIGNTITYGYTQPAAYYWNLQANGGAIEQIDTTESVNFVASGNLTVTRTGNTITYGYTQPAAYYWNLQANGGAIEQIDTNEAVNFAAGGNLTVARAGNTITYTYTQPAAYDWYAGDGSTSTQISAGEFVRWQGDSGVVVSLNTSTQTFTIDRPLQLQQEGTNIGNDSTVTINWDNATVSKPIGHTGRVWTEIIDDGAGTRRLIAWYEPGAGAYYWNLQANGGAIEQIDTAESVNFTASGNLTVTRTGNTINYSYNEPAPYKWVASDGTNVADITANETVVITGDATTTVTFNSGTQTFTISRPLTIKQSGTAVGNNNTRDINFANATLTKPAGYTSQGWVEVTDNPANGANRDIKVFFEPPTATYGWNIEADNPIGVSAAVANGATVKFSGTNGIITRRVNDDIIISISDDYGPGTPADSKEISGFIEFPNNVADYIGAVPYRYGTRQYVDILHNFDLGNQNAFELHLVDVNHDENSNLIIYRSGATTMSGENAGSVKFRNIPHWAAIDNNTIRVWATMSRGKPTNMKFWYTLRAF